MIVRRLRDVLNKARTSDLLTYRAFDEFKGKSARNKSNRAFRRGGAVHTIGRKAHIQVPLDMLRRDVDPMKFLWPSTQKKTIYHDRLREVKLQIGDNSITDGSTKLQIWKDVVGGKTRGHCYGTGDLSTNIRPGVTSLTQESRAYTSGSDGSLHSSNEAMRQEVIEAKL